LDLVVGDRTSLTGAIERVAKSSEEIFGALMVS
jgi:hypothetical protein